MTQAIINNDFFSRRHKRASFCNRATRFFEQSVIWASRVNYFLVSRAQWASAAEFLRLQSKKLEFSLRNRTVCTTILTLLLLFPATSAAYLLPVGGSGYLESALCSDKGKLLYISIVPVKTWVNLISILILKLRSESSTYTLPTQVLPMYLLTCLPILPN